jgi:hypothetical protein
LYAESLAARSGTEDDRASLLMGVCRRADRRAAAAELGHPLRSVSFAWGRREGAYAAGTWSRRIDPTDASVPAAPHTKGSTDAGRAIQRTSLRRTEG